MTDHEQAEAVIDCLADFQVGDRVITHANTQLRSYRGVIVDVQDQGAYAVRHDSHDLSPVAITLLYFRHELSHER